jgi:DNA repair protein RadC
MVHTVASGDPKPSRDIIEMTKQIAKGCRSVGS